MSDLQAYLYSCRELALLCTQNGWIDNETLKFDIIDQQPNVVIAAVTFEEVVMKGTGCIGRRIPCYGRVAAYLGNDQTVQRLEILRVPSRAWR